MAASAEHHSVTKPPTRLLHPRHLPFVRSGIDGGSGSKHAILFAKADYRATASICSIPTAIQRPSLVAAIASAGATLLLKTSTLPSITRSKPSSAVAVQW